MKSAGVRGCRVRSGAIEVDGRPQFIYSGEIHYFRVDPKDWPHRLKLARRAGLNTVSSYIPWRWHEMREGKFDFTGRTHPGRNLKRWFDAVADAGLLLIARIGPVSNAELILEGLPDWLMSKYPDVQLQNRRGVLAYRSPVFLDKVAKWYRALLPHVRPHRRDAGGPIVLTQLCNEIGMVHWLCKAADLSPRATKDYRLFLEKKYKNITLLNMAWGRPMRKKGVYLPALRSWSQIVQPTGAVPEDRWAECHDWALFYRDYYAGYYAALADMAKAGGMRGPYIANIPQFWDYDVRGRGQPAPMTSSLFRDFQLKVGEPVLFGGAYQMRRLDIDNFHDIAMATESANLPHPDRDVPALCAELQTGIMRDRPRLYGTDVELNLKTSAAQGLAGVNGYMFCGGESTDDMGAFGRYHEWQAAVDSNGRERPHFEAMRRFGRWVGCVGTQMAKWRKAADTALGVYMPYLMTEYLQGEWTGKLVSERDRYWFDGIARMLMVNQYNIRFVDIDRPGRGGLTAAAVPDGLWVYTTERMDEAAQRRLMSFVETGGRLMIGPTIPTLDLSGRRCRIIADALGVGRIDPLTERRVKIAGQSGGRGEAWLDGTLISARVSGARPVLKTVGGTTVAWLKRFGRGTVLFGGLPLCHTFDPVVDLVGEMARALGIQPRAVADADGEIPLVWRGTDREGVLLVPNYHDRPVRARIRLRAPAFSSGELVLPPRRAYFFPVGVEVLPGIRIDATGEFQDIRVTGRTARLVFDFPAGRNHIRLLPDAAGRNAKIIRASMGVLKSRGKNVWELVFAENTSDIDRNDVELHVRFS